jgi:hypothetical protein
MESQEVRYHIGPTFRIFPRAQAHTLYFIPLAEMALQFFLDK